MSKKFDISKMDCEEKFGFAAEGFTFVGKLSSMIPGVILTAIVYGILSLLKTAFPENDMLLMFFPGGEAGRTFIPVITLFFAMWCWAMLWMKKRKLAVQKKLLQALQKCSDQAEKEIFIAGNVEDISSFAAAEMFVLERKLTENGQSPAEKDALLSSTAADYEKASDTSFIPVSTLIWSIPVLGFIGTVLGLAKAVSKFGALAGSGSQVGFNAVLPQITGGLATAFETTLIALVLALALQILASWRRQAEERFFGSLKNNIVAGTAEKNN